MDDDPRHRKSFSEPFVRAMVAAMRDQELADSPGAHDDLFDTPELLAAGLDRGDTLQMLQAMHAEYAHDLSEGGPPMAVALLAIIEICLSTGVHLERARQNEANDILSE